MILNNEDKKFSRNRKRRISGRIKKEDRSVKLRNAKNAKRKINNFDKVKRFENALVKRK